jgi:hypothetical protein
MKRRDSLGAMMAMSASTCLPPSVWSTVSGISPEQQGLHLDVQQAGLLRDISVATCLADGSVWATNDLILTAYSSASVDAIELLCEESYGVVHLGLTTLPVEVAKALTNMRMIVLSFTRLESISSESTEVLSQGGWLPPYIAFDALRQIDVVTVRHLLRAAGEDGSLSFCGLTSPLALQVAEALVEYPLKTLDIELHGQPLSPSAARALSFFTGWQLKISTTVRPTDEAFRALAFDPKKMVGVKFSTAENPRTSIKIQDRYQEYAYMCDRDMVIVDKNFGL